MPERIPEFRLDDVATINPEAIDRRNPPAKIRYIDIAAVSSGSIDDGAIRELDFTEAPSRAQRVVRAGDTIISTVRPYLRAGALITPELDGCVASTGFAVVRAKDGAVTSAYLWELLQSDGFYAHLEARQAGALYPAVRPADVAEAVVSVPSIEEQLRIADLLSTVYSVILRAERSAQTSGDAARALRAALMTKPQWERVELKDAVEVTMGRQRSPKHQAGDHVIPYMRAANVKDGHLALESVLAMNFTPAEQQKYTLLPGDVLVTEGCGSRAQIGASARWSAEVEGAVAFQNTLIRLRAVEGKTCEGFVYHWARWAFESGLFASIARGANILHIGALRTELLEFPLAPLSDQEDVVDLLEPLERAARLARVERERLLVLRRSIQAELFSGSRSLPKTYDRFLSNSAPIAAELAVV